MKVTRIKKLMISGISAVTNNELEMSEENGKIAQLWEDYFANDVYKKTFDKANGKNILTFIAFDELPVGMVKKVREKKYVWTCPGSI